MKSKNNVPQFFYDETGKTVRVLLKPVEFENLIEKLEELYDLDIIRKRAKKKERTYTLEEVMTETRERMSKR